MKERPVQQIMEEIINHLEKNGTCSITNLLDSIGGNRNKIIKAKNALVKKGRIKQERDINDTRKYKLTLLEPKLDISLEALMSSLPLAEQRVDKLILKVNKPLFVHVEIKDGEVIPFKIKPRNKKILDQVLVTINDLAERSIALTFAEVMKMLPKGSQKNVKRFQLKCIKTMKKIMQKLEKEFKESEMELNSYLYYNTHGFRHLSNLEFLNQENSL